MLSGGGLPHWVSWLTTLVVVAAVAGFVVTHRGGITGLSEPTSTPLPPAKPVTPLHRPGEMLDAEAGPGGVWTLSGSRLSLVDGTRVVRSVALRGVRLPSTSTPRLAVDPVTGAVWLVVSDAAPSLLIEYDPDSLQVVRRMSWDQLVHGAVAYRGHLYLATDLGTADLAPDGRRPREIAGLGAGDGPIALDPVRGRLIVMNVGYPTRVWTYRPGQYPLKASVALPLGGGTVAVVNGAIWVGGFSNRAVLDRLDPTSLRPIRKGAVEPFGPGAVIVAGGSNAFWVRPGNGTHMLACVSARTGRIEQRWQLPDLVSVASQNGTALAATHRGAIGLVLAGCTG